MGKRIKIKVDQETVKKRWGFCKSCPYLMKGTICQKCGCVMPAKVRLGFAKCPIGKW